jgi:hypothetical protein
MKKMMQYFIYITIFFFISTPFTTAIESDHLINETLNRKSIYENTDDFTLFTPTSSKITYLINREKEVVVTWDSIYFPGQSVYLLENGNILRTAYIGFHPIFIAGGRGGGVQEIERKGTVVWEFKYSDPNYLSHHDIEVLPNGNVLMIAWEYKTGAEAISKGRNPNTIILDQLWPDHVIEVKPTGPNSGDIVWEWHVWDHTIQDFDPTKENYGNVADHPELIDINYIENPLNINPDWTHTNSIDYNEEFDQILLSVNTFNEIWVIDHSTTSEEAAGHTGGIYGKGGDLLYRWGNPQTYKRGDASDRFFYHQHDAQWIDNGLPGAGNILVFNNGDGRPDGPYSSIVELTPPVDDNGFYEISPDLPYGPLEPIWIYTASNPLDFFSRRTSGNQRLNNGNTLICNSYSGTFFEVNYEKETVWEYVNPYPTPKRNSVFKIRQYTSDYPGVVTILNQPNIPEKPNGPISGKIGEEYTFSTVTNDPQNDQVLYLFDWGDGTDSDWLGPFNSGVNIYASHSWTDQKTYKIRVKAKDTNEFFSGWSNPLNMIIPRSKQRITTQFNILLNNFDNLFPMLKILLQLLD